MTARAFPLARGWPSRRQWPRADGFALMLPVFMTLSMTGAELTNYITTKMRISQLALQLADDAARIGTGCQSLPKRSATTSTIFSPARSFSPATRHQY